MVQIYEENRRPSFAQSIMQGLTEGVAPAIQYYQKSQNDREMNNKYKDVGQQLLGIDLSGFDPETSKALLVEGLKQQGKGKIQGEKQDYLNELFGGKKNAQPNSFQDRLQGESDEIPSIEEVTGNPLPDNFDVLNISDEDIARGASIDPNLGRALSHAKDVALREKRESIKHTTEEKNRLRKEELDFHKESQKYDEDLTEKTRRAKSQVETINDIEKAVKSGNVKPSSWTNIFRNFGDTGKSFANAIMNKDEATVLSSIPQLLEGWKQVFGVRLTDADLKVLQDKLPDIGKSADANKAILNVMRKYGKMTLLRSEIASDIKKKNKGLRPLGYSDQIEQRFDEMTKSVRVVNPNTGNIIEIPAYQVGDAIASGASLADE